MPDTNTPQLFHIGDILGILTGSSLAPRIERPAMPDGTIPPTRKNAFEGIEDLANHMAGKNLEIQQLMLAEPQIREALAAQHKKLTKIKVPEVPLESLRDEMAERHPELLNRLVEKIRPVWESSTHLDRLEATYTNPEQLATLALKHLSDGRWIISGFMDMAAGYEFGKAPHDTKESTAARKALWDTGKLFKECQALFEADTQEYLKPWITEMERKHGAYLPVTPLKHLDLDRIDRQFDTISAGKSRLVVGNPDMAAALVTKKYATLNTRELDTLRVQVSDYYDTAQAVLAVAGHHVPALVITAEQIRQNGRYLDIALDTSDAADAQRIATQFHRCFTKDGADAPLLERYTTLEFKTGEQDEYVLRLNAEAMRQADRGRKSTEAELDGLAADLVGREPELSQPLFGGVVRFLKKFSLSPKPPEYKNLGKGLVYSISPETEFEGNCTLFVRDTGGDTSPVADAIGLLESRGLKCSRGKAGTNREGRSMSCITVSGSAEEVRKQCEKEPALASEPGRWQELNASLGFRR